MHAVQRLYQYRQSITNKDFNGRGYRVARCENCRIADKFCICQHKPSCHSDAAFLLLMYDDEVLKPSNSGRLIADLIDETHAFLWSRSDVSAHLIALINDPQWQPFVVFPQVYAGAQQQVVNRVPPLSAGKRPLFILLDGTWREAKKIFRKSPYLADLPVLSINLDQQSEDNRTRYRMRRAVTDGQLATAEVAARVLASYGELDNAHLMDLWFDLFSLHFQHNANSGEQNRAMALARLQKFTAQLSR